MSFPETCPVKGKTLCGIALRRKGGSIMAKLEENRIRISVRNLVEFLLRDGDIDNRRKGKRELEAMAAGARIHRKIQRSMGGGYRAEVPLKTEFTLDEIILSLEGRADGLFHAEKLPAVDEIKGVYWDFNRLEEPLPVHRAQAVCYAYMALESGEFLTEAQKAQRSAEASERDSLAAQETSGPESVLIQITYCQMETEEIRRFREVLSADEIKAYVRGLAEQYGMWARFLYQHRMERNASIRGLEFPFAYRPGQRDLAVTAYRAMEKKKTLFIQAPTGIGKTMAVLFPAVKAVGEGLEEKIFYLTAKTITRTVAEEGLETLRAHGLRASGITLTAKE